MKKLLGMASIILSFGLVLAGCQGGATESTDVSSTVEKTEQAEELTLYVVRHGKTMLNTTDRVQGWSDAVLTPAGEEIVTAAGVGLKDIDFQAAYSSDSGRAVQTAQLILDENKASSHLELHTDRRLREFNFGSYEGDLNHTMWQDIADDHGVSLEEFLANMNPKDFADSVAKLDKERMKKEGIEEGVNWPAEDYDTITSRLTEGLDAIVEEESKHPGTGNILITSHGLSISALLDTLFEEFDVPEGGLKNASVNIIKYKDGKYTLGTVNDMSYAEAGQAAE
ncbi:histidine phosphatase family protein [Enterococcus saccharolyticus]|uniref:Phosphoglycerate mutase n=1 Tax=Candidatus Enterococcus willemsii TaxID=1857215 RepID=A0ABQ6YZQ1_9ENTE|nr:MULTISPECIES: histidine phosphatase family protein [Enterococcus]KAF1304094.1 phosphoglycerate mutase [Enterococcus sp. CU12B]MCD5002033.1 histidine phosphatase family protein [Enterococcus saccharolyticus]